MSGHIHTVSFGIAAAVRTHGRNSYVRDVSPYGAAHADARKFNVAVCVSRNTADVHRFTFDRHVDIDYDIQITDLGSRNHSEKTRKHFFRNRVDVGMFGSFFLYRISYRVSVAVQFAGKSIRYRIAYRGPFRAGEIEIGVKIVNALIVISAELGAQSLEVLRRTYVVSERTYVGISVVHAGDERRRQNDDEYQCRYRGNSFFHCASSFNARTSLR